MAFGKRGYGFGAANLAASLRYHRPDIHIHLLTEPGCVKQLTDFHRGLFTEIELIPVEAWQTGGKTDPGKAKCHLRKMLPEGPWLFVDADSIALQDITPLWEDLLSSGVQFATEVIGEGVTNVEYTPWAKPEDIARKVGKDGATVYGINTSWMFLGEGPFFDRVAHHFDALTWKRSELVKTWGTSMPDELIYSTTCTELGVDPEFGRRVFFGVDNSETRLSDIASKFEFITLYGNGRGTKTQVKRRYIDMIDPYLQRVYKHLGSVHILKVQQVLNDKYLG